MSHNPYLTSWQKRAFDLVVVILLSPILLLLLLLVVVLYACSSIDTWVYKQQREGLGGQPFVLYKFKTLNNPTQNNRAAMVKNDGTVIPGIGDFMRRWRFDEIPQIWNIIKGDMSWVGPRPEQWELAQEFANQNPQYAKRNSAKPGIAGLAQVYNPNATVDEYNEKLQHDLKYLMKASLFLDIRVLIASIWVVLKGN